MGPGPEEGWVDAATGWGMRRKKRKSTVHYRSGYQTRNCGICRYMNKDGTCQLVQGIVTPKMLCDLWAKKEKA